MIFTQAVFFLFFAITFGVYWALRSYRAQKLWLLAASYFFYGYWDYRFLALIFGCTVFDFVVGRVLGRVEAPRRRRVLLGASLLANLGLLGLFKYFNFFIESAGELLRALGFPVGHTTLSLLLPAGISFFTFQSMSYTIDVYRRELSPCKSFLDFAMFIAFFPQLVAGPIVRARTFLPQLDTQRRLADVAVRSALVLFLVGYFKKACLADNIAALIDPVFANPTSAPAADRALSSVLYSVQIYCDFSGYSDMAIASANLLGFELTKNFEAPYFSRNLREFWQRWHISLSTWLRDYLYIPLGGNRGGAWRASRNLMLTMLLGGLWHGANWTFILWGFLHGLGLAAHRLWSTRVHAPLLPAHWQGVSNAFSTALTFAWVAACFTIFRCVDIGTAFRFFSTPAAESAVFTVTRDLWFLVALLGGAQWLVFSRREAIAAWLERVPDRAFYPALGAACAMVLYFTAPAVEAFIYFQF